MILAQPEYSLGGRIIPAVADTVFPNRINGIIGTDRVRGSNLDKRCMKDTITHVLFFRNVKILYRL